MAELSVEPTSLNMHTVILLIAVTAKANKTKICFKNMITFFKVSNNLGPILKSDSYLNQLFCELVAVNQISSYPFTNEPKLHSISLTNAADFIHSYGPQLQ